MMTLTYTAIQTCIVLSDVIDAFAEDRALVRDEGASDIRSDLCAAYAALCEALSRELRVDAHRMIQQRIGNELDTSRTILAGQTGLCFPIEARE